MRILLPTLFLLCVVLSASARRVDIHTYQPRYWSNGHSSEIIVRDAQNGDPLIGATVSLISKTDTLRGATAKRDFGFSVQAGFTVDHRFRDSVTLEVRYVGYQTFEKRYAAREFNNFITVDLEIDPQSIAQVVVVGKQIAMVLRGDTTVYNAGAFRTFSDDRIGELLKQLPGVEVKDNKIYSDGKEVRRVLIDGRNLFGNAPQNALTDLEASDVKSVRIYEDLSSSDKRLDDNTAEKEKVMNIETKSKRAVLRGGELSATLGASLEKDYSGRHEIRHAESATLYRNSERNNLRMNLLNSKDDGNKEHSSRITPNKQSYGELTHMLRRGDSTLLINSVSVGRSRNNNRSATRTDYFATPEYTIRTDESHTNSQSEQTSVDFEHSTYLGRRKSAFMANLNVTLQNNDSQTDSRSLQQIDEQITQTQLGNQSHGSNYRFSGSIGYSLKISKLSTLSFSVDGNYGNNRTNGWQVDTTASTPGLRVKLRQDGSGNDYGLTVQADYRYQLGKYGALNANYSFERTYNHSLELAIDFLDNPQGKTDPINSYKYTNDNSKHTLSTSLEYHKDELWLRAMIDMTSAHIARREYYPDEGLFPRNFLLLNPSIYLSHNTKKRRILLSINAFSQPPTIESLRNTINATNPLSLQAGNPDLKLSRNLSGNFSIQFTKPETARRIYLMFSGGYIINQATSRRTLFLEDTYLERYDYTAQKGSQLTTQVNVNGCYNVGGSVIYEKQFEPIRSTFRTSADYSFRQTPYYLADKLLKSRNHGLNYRVSLTTGFSRKVKFDLASNTALTRTVAQGTTADELRQTLTGRSDLRFGKYFGMVECYYQFYRNSRSKSLTNQNTIFSAYAGRKFGKHDRLACSIGVIDLFNRSDYTKTTINTDYITASTSAYLGRYLYVKATYTF